MNLSWIPSLGMYLLGIVVIAFTFKQFLNKTKPSSKEKLSILLQAEHDAQYTRSKVLPSELLLHVDFEKYPFVDHIECQKKYQQLMRYAKLPMVNLQGQTNLELKQAYGPQTLEKIGQYEKNYFSFMDISIQYGKILYENGYVTEARQALEQCLIYHCDVSKCYILLIEIYKRQNDYKALDELKNIVQIEMSQSPFLHKVLVMLEDNKYTKERI